MEQMLHKPRSDIRDEMQQQIRTELDKSFKAEINEVAAQLKSALDADFTPLINDGVHANLQAVHDKVNTVIQMWKSAADTASDHKIVIEKHGGMLSKLPGYVHDEIEKHLEQRDKRIDGLIIQLADLRAKQYEHDEELETIKRHDRLDTLLIDSFLLEKGKSLKQNVVENIKYYLDIDMSCDEIKLISKFGSRQDPSKTSLRVKFFNPERKTELMSMKGKLRGTDVFFREHLTPPPPNQLDILVQAKEAQKH